MNGSCWSDLPMVGYKGNKVFVCFAKFGECELYLGYLQFPSGHDMSLGTIFLRWLLNEFVLTEHEMEPQPLLNAIGYRGWLERFHGCSSLYFPQAIWDGDSKWLACFSSWSSLNPPPVPIPSSLSCAGWLTCLCRVGFSCAAWRLVFWNLWNAAFRKTQR